MQQNTSVFQAALHIQLIKKSYYSFQLGGRKQKHSEAKKLFQEKLTKFQWICWVLNSGHQHQHSSQISQECRTTQSKKDIYIDGNFSNEPL